MKINERIAFLRKQKGCTQEQLASALGVTNQSVSKWESGQCCPDIQLLPEIAKFFGVSIDALMGCEPVEGLGEICLKIREHFAALPEKQAFEDCYRIAALLHEAALTDGYKERLPWKEGRDYATDDVSSWGMSVHVSDAGCTERRRNGIFFSLGRGQRIPTGYQLRTAAAQLKMLGDPDVLATLCALYDCTNGTEEGGATAAEIARSAHLPEEKALAALEQLPVKELPQDAGKQYRPDDSYQLLAPLLMMTFSI